MTGVSGVAESLFEESLRILQDGLKRGTDSSVYLGSLLRAFSDFSI